MGIQAHDLAASVARLSMMTGHARPAEMAGAVDAIRCTAQAEGRLPVVALARAIEAALARGERGVVIDGWIAMMREAIGCERSDADCTGIYLAAAAVRLAH
ncbi:MAG: hypothetical protein J0I47_13315 [Sphingomonas sp.]|uniref:hypothetical protein n=1 Tax=Sphingomonas sp. TaxID=28214 RepID=UPI001AC26F50|nr:hypothetical protein [Sphingomonas sp.]MBN8809198.1 hypothetical protein [Sphingomonas sp.]